MEPDAKQAQKSARMRISGISSELDPEFEDKIAEVFKGANLALCYQCGACSASCPTMDRMKYGPRKIMHMIHLGMAEEVLRSQDIWFCVSCYSCAARCPQGVEITEVMAALRNLAIARGLAKDKEATFSQIFVKVVQRYGRMYEPEMLLRYDASGISLGDLVKQAELGLRMLRKGKIGLLPERIEQVEELLEIIAGASEGEER